MKACPLAEFGFREGASRDNKTPLRGFLFFKLVNFQSRRGSSARESSSCSSVPPRAHGRAALVPRFRQGTRRECDRPSSKVFFKHQVEVADSTCGSRLV